MARIPQEKIDRLKSEISIERLVEASGVSLTRHGKDLIGLCPFHKDTHPSLVVSPDKNVWHCLGVCQTGGSVIDWVMKSQGVSFRHAVLILSSDQIPTGPVRRAKRTSAPQLPSPVERTADDQALLRQVTWDYHQTLKESPEALAYLKSRGIDSGDLVDRFQIGFANRTLGLRLPPKCSKEGAQIRGRLQKLGILRDTGHEHFNGSLVIPVMDEQGNVLEMYGRKITPKLRAGTPDHLYLPGDHHGVFNIQALAQYPEIILCEALIDALTFLNAGSPNVTSSYGAGGFTEDHWAAFRKFKTQRVLIAYDRDEAGEKGATTLAETLMEAGIECFRIQFPRGMDANEYALKVHPAAKSLGLVIRKAVWMGKGPSPRRSELSPVVETVPVQTSEPPPPAPPPASPPEAASPLPTEFPGPATAEPDQKAAGSPPDATLASEPPASPSSPLPSASEPRPPAIEIQPTRPTTTAEVVSLIPPASPQPPAPQPIPIDQQGAHVRLALGDRQYRICGLAKNLNPGQLKVNILVERGDEFHSDTIDLCISRPRNAFSRDAALELGVAEDVIKKDLGRVLRALEELQDEQLKAAVAPKIQEVVVPGPDREEALDLLGDPHLLDRVLADFHRYGVVGEETNLLLGYLAAVSRLLDTPLAVVIQSSSAAGKSSLMEAILAFMPPEWRVKFSAMTGQSLFYLCEDLKHKILAIVEEEGAEKASYALKLLQSEGELSIASTGKDPSTGRHVTHEYRVEGPVMIFLTTTAVEVDEELLNRCVVLSADEDRDQTRGIHHRQRDSQTLEGQLKRRDVSHIMKRQQNLQRLLRPLLVANPYAPQLTFRDDQTRMRRDHPKYLTLIRCVTLLHQYQRPIKTVEHQGQTIEYIEVTREDIGVANRLANEVLGRTLDELPPQTRRLLVRLDAWVREECARLQMSRADFRFQRSDVRARGWAHTQARSHLDFLVELEYVYEHRGTRGQAYVYELVYDGQGQDGQKFVMGLIDPETLKEPDEYDEKLAGSVGELAGPKKGLAEG